MCHAQETQCLRPAESGGSSRPVGRGAAPPTLESGENKVTEGLGLGEILAYGDGCGHRMCPTCGPGVGRKLRAALEARADLFPVPRLLTLTIDRKGTRTQRGFMDPEAAHRFVTQGKYIPRLMRALGIARWVWVLEPHKGEGWPHWHLLVDASELADHRVPLKMAWGFWRNDWKIGGLKLSKGSFEGGAVHAIRYVTKYLTKYPEEGFPSWMLDRMGPGRKPLRFVGSSRAVGALLSVSKPPDAEQVDADDAQEVESATDEPRYRYGSYRQRLAMCGKTVNVFLRTELPDGSDKWQWKGSLPVSMDNLMLLCLAGCLKGMADLVVEEGRRCRVRLHRWVRLADMEQVISRAVQRGWPFIEQLAACHGVRVERDSFGRWGWSLCA